jgi:hypothetical protein
MSVVSVSWGAVAKERQSIGITASGQSVLFDTSAQMNKVVPSGIAAHKRAGHDFSGVVVEGQNQHRQMIGGPPLMGGTVMLPKFTNGASLPAAAGLGARFQEQNALGKMK